MDSLPEDKVPDMATAPEENGQLESESSTDVWLFVVASSIYLS